MRASLRTNPCRHGLAWPPCRCERCFIRYTGRALLQHYGRDQAVKIINGEDQAANADLAAWNRLGSAERQAVRA